MLKFQVYLLNHLKREALNPGHELICLELPWNVPEPTLTYPIRDLDSVDKEDTSLDNQLIFKDPTVILNHPWHERFRSR